MRVFTYLYMYKKTIPVGPATITTEVPLLTSKRPSTPTQGGISSNSFMVTLTRADPLLSRHLRSNTIATRRQVRAMKFDEYVFRDGCPSDLWKNMYCL